MRTAMNVLCLSILLSLGSAASAAGGADTKSTSAASVDRSQIDAFFTLLKQNHIGEAVDGVMKSSPLWGNKVGAKEQLVAQIDAAIKIYGPVATVELLSTESKGTMLVRQFWLAQHANMVTRWEFDLVRTANGWQIGYFGFTDQVTNWF